MRGFKAECANFSFNKCPIYTHDGASAKFSTNSHEKDNSVGILVRTLFYSFRSANSVVRPTLWFKLYFLYSVSVCTP
jgi:hypothetical protein